MGTMTVKKTTKRRRPVSFLDLPPEIRHEIYTLALSWPNLRGLFDRLRRECEQDEAAWFAHSSLSMGLGDMCNNACPLPSPSIPESRYTTPTIFLLNRQITYEALPVLHAQELVIDEPPPYSMALGRPVDITVFISEGALQRARRVVLKIDIANLASRWARTVDTLLDVWWVDNGLEKLRIVVVGGLAEGRRNMIGEEGVRIIVLKMFAKLRKFGMENPSGVKVLFEGSSPPHPPVKWSLGSISRGENIGT
ncbi:hypothetical protein BDBG_00132 [Blastomyces gilchristii SLH14081]|uniref:F-box domain-containing protein n=1 Tax=Blastomyces gilchristii (strain SLH14081) TaxID=559298 RepID=A0A179U6N8_BLAGS|nr:uncharacterized protein BDBG_00132 [Blastomyces gilchristii SLH14081]OAT03403.1 hypothetical protein BDBG_00132 [Blastomyces gilchristii SLH14081]